MISRVLSVAVVLLAVTAAPAATVEVEMRVTGADTWEVVATASPASMIAQIYPNDNAGLAGFSLELLNTTSITITAPKGLDAPMTIRGFSISGLMVLDAGTGLTEAFGGQDTLSPSSLVYGVGQTAGSVGDLTPASWAVPVVLAQGTYGAQLPVLASVEANVFETDQDVFSQAADVVIIPEPATLALLTLGGMALIRRRR